jgi:hypothetical protein
MKVVIDSTLVLAVLASGCASSARRVRPVSSPSHAAQREAATHDRRKGTDIRWRRISG